MTGLIRKCVRSGLATVPLGTLQRLTATKLILPFYHLVSDDEVPHVNQLYPYFDVRRFTQDMEYLLHHYQPVTLQDLLAHLEKGQDFAQNSFLLSFDDGLREIHDVVAPLLKAKGIPATFFLTTDFLNNKNLGRPYKAGLLLDIGEKRPEVAALIRRILQAHGLESENLANALKGIRHDQEGILDEIATAAGVDFNEYLRTRKPFLDSAQVDRLLSDGFTIGAHSIDHPLYALLSLQEQLHQTSESMEILAKRFSLSYRVFAFPHEDKGVSNTYFREVFRRKLVDASFGTAGMVEDVHPRSLQRLWMESDAPSAGERLRQEYIDYAQWCLTGGRPKMRRWA